MPFELNNIDLGSEATTKPDSIFLREIDLTRSFGSRQKEKLFSELGILLSAGMNLKRSLTLLSNSQKKKKAQTVLRDLLTSLEEGKSFSSSIQNHPYFSDYDHQVVTIGEQTGKLALSISELGTYYQLKNEQQRNLISALTYPAVIMVSSVLAILFMLSYVVPIFADIFSQNDVELPWITEWLIDLSNVIKKYSWYLVLGLGVSIFLMRALWVSDWFKQNLSKYLIRVPVFGEVYRLAQLTQFTHSMSLLTSAQIPVLQSIETCRKMVQYYPLQKALEQVSEEVMGGISLSASLAQHEIFDGRFNSLIEVAEETNSLPSIFEELHTIYTRELGYRTKILNTVLEPLIIIFLGLIVGIILVAMYLPMFKLSTILG